MGWAKQKIICTKNDKTLQLSLPFPDPSCYPWTRQRLWQHLPVSWPTASSELKSGQIAAGLVGCC